MYTDALKSALIRTPIGDFAQHVRERWALRRAHPDTVGCMANNLTAHRLLGRLCGDGARFLDIGAHLGSVIQSVRSHSRPSEIIAIEAIPHKAAALRQAFPAVTVHQCALGERTGEIPFFIAESASGYSSIDPALARRQGGVREIRVPMLRLDDLLADRTGIDLAKLDVEGAELGVLRGAEETIAASRPTFVFESGTETIEEYPKEALWRWFRAHDYMVLVPNRVPHQGPGLGEAEFCEAHCYPPRTTDFIAIAAERRDEVRERARHVLGMAAA